MSYTFTIGGESSFTLLPEAERVRVLFDRVEPNKFNDKALRFVFILDDPDYDGGEDADVDTAIQEASESGYSHYENVNIPAGDIGKRTKLYKYLKGMSGGDFDEGSKVDLNEYTGEHYLADFERVEKKMPNADGSFSTVRDDNGKIVLKAEIVKLRPARKAKKAKAEKVEAAVIPNLPDNDDDLDLEEA